ncbi:dihydrouridine synthase-domain-containing protein [Xylaria bambusicola]|uniref:dihydrouridine synthase-domain-containing protein n=1 Tax=Xylaria bambusicola TaxID=326684 RepID=UPI002008A096|nr:dihydrouridine synthase-domain-containing protein [Xylaria bambusicola]KAI0526549.1 dihydrouridine synthase-domain-containing protein [Xylaria bambusicola]
MASTPTPTPASTSPKPKLHGRAFYESIGSPQFIVAPMVDQSEFAWRTLTRSFLTPQENAKLLAYTPMFHARLFEETPKYRDAHFQATRQPVGTADADPASPFLDGNPKIDRPLFVQFCANDPDHLLHAAQMVAPYCDAVDLNLGCPQGIARKGHYGAFLQEDQELIYKLINNLHRNLSVPVTAKIRILDTKEDTLAYAKNVLSAGASILTVHGRRREQKGHLTGVADWGYIRYLRENLPKETVIFANGNILQHGDIQRCLQATGADAVMSAEGNLSDPSIFAAPPPVGQEGREYWRGRDGKGGYRVDAVFRRYMDILHKYALEQEPPKRRPLFVVGDDDACLQDTEARNNNHEEGPARKKLKQDGASKRSTSPNIVAVRPHLFHLLRHFISKHTDIRDTLARTNPGDINGIEKVLNMVERRVAQGLIDYERTDGKSLDEEPVLKSKPQDKGLPEEDITNDDIDPEDDPESSVATVRACKRPWWITQPIIRPLPKEALAKGSIRLSKKDQKRQAKEQEAAASVVEPPVIECIDSKGESHGQTHTLEDELPISDEKDGGIREPSINPLAPGLTKDTLVSG